MNRVPTTILTSYYKLGLLGFKTPKREREKERKKLFSTRCSVVCTTWFGFCACKKSLLWRWPPTSYVVVIFGIGFLKVVFGDFPSNNLSRQILELQVLRASSCVSCIHPSKIKWMLWKFYEFDGMSSEVLKTSNQFVGEGEGCLAPCSSEPCFE